MAYLGQSINTGEVEYNTGSRDPLPAGVYSLVVVRSQQKDTKKKDGVFVEVEFDITAPDGFTRRKFWDTFNIMNPSAEATRIGLEQLGKLAKAAGIPVLQDDQELLNAEVQAEIYIGKDNNGTPRNRVSGYYPMGVEVKAFKEQVKAKAGGQPAASQPAGAARPAAAAASAGGPSWRKPVA
ncbi:DUF669 domain-containing protein [Phenylobacterium sp.]|uniref:DUF669 domain-containing protein n=1 Tax=Phenylobacterium sp. TaxID=1871053 RepID=UPI00301C5DE0